MQFFTPTEIGPKRAKTPDGFLILYEVPLARTGSQLYGPGEVPPRAKTASGEIVDVLPAPNGSYTVDRPEDEVFHPVAMASFEGKSFADEHPEPDITPENYLELSKGHVQNIRRGTGDLADQMVGDIFVSCPHLIEELEDDDGRREVSCGYDSDYEYVSPGRLIQRNIKGNHVALVDSGRCGGRCSIRDRNTNPKEGRMAKIKVRDLLTRAFKAKDAKALDDLMAEAGGGEAELPMGGNNIVSSDGEGDTHLHVHMPGAAGATGEMQDADPEEEAPAWFKKHAEATDARFKDIEGVLKGVTDSMAKMAVADADETPEEKEAREKREKEGKTDDKEIEGALKEEAPPGTGDAAVKARDSALVEDSFNETIALAEIIVPGIGFPTFDRAAKPTDTVRNLCAFRKKVLDRAAAASDADKSALISYLGARTWDAKTPCGTVRSAFLHIGALKRQRNADMFQAGKLPALANEGEMPSMLSPLAMNELAAKIYGNA